MTIRAIYKQYKIPPNLQRHMLRVAGVAEIITENWNGKTLDKKAITLCCLFHDAAKLINIDLSSAKLLEEEEENIAYWRTVQKELVEKYGADEYKATLEIGRKIGLSGKSIKLLGEFEWRNIPEYLKANNFESAIAIYADMRVGPFGVLSMEERLENLRSRRLITDYDVLVENGRMVEKRIQENLTIDIDSITDEEVNKHLDALRNLEVG